MATKSKNKQRAIAIAAALALLAPGRVAAHGFHAAITEVHYNARGQSLEIVHQLFAHDVVEVLNVAGGTRVTIASPDLEARLNAYLATTFAIAIDGAAATPDWVGIEVDADTIIAYQEIAAATAPASLDIANTMLMEEFPAEQNLVNVDLGGATQSHRFVDGDTFHTFKAEAPAP